MIVAGKHSNYICIIKKHATSILEKSIKAARLGKHGSKLKAKITQEAPSHPPKNIPSRHITQRLDAHLKNEDE
jgi:hypothetical protein